MHSPVTRRAVLVFLAQSPIALAACGVANSQDQPPTPEPTATHPPATSTPAPTATQPPPPTATPEPTPAPPLAEARPATILQGGTSTVVLNAPATQATVSFRERLYPMTRSGDRLWAIVGAGAFADLREFTASISYQLPGQAGAQGATVPIRIVNANYPVESITLSPSVAALLAPDIVLAEIQRRAQIFGVFTPRRLWTGPFQRPSTAPISDGYGSARSYNGAPATDYHKGTDFAGPTGDPIIAAAAGNVVFAEELKVRGNSVIVDHGVGVFTAYHHLSAFAVAQGESVTAGQRLGSMGETGLVTGPHLHFEIVVRGVEVNAEEWLKGVDFAL